MFCVKCGKEISDGSLYCGNCGTSNGTNIKKAETEHIIWETTTEEVAPILEDSTIEKYEAFGWEVKSSQTIYNKDSHLENRYGSIYSVSETTNFVKLTFRRNKKMPRIEELRALEEEYDDLSDPATPNKPSIFLLIGGVVSISFLLLFPLGIILLAVYFTKKSKYEKELEIWAGASNDIMEKREAILEKAKAIIDNI